MSIAHIIILVAVLVIIFQSLLISAYIKSEKGLYQIISEKDRHLGIMDKILKERKEHTELLFKENYKIKKQLIHAKRMVESLRRKNIMQQK